MYNSNALTVYEALKNETEHQKSLYCRLNSIYDDAKFVKRFCEPIPFTIPIFRNLRCGTWYVPSKWYTTNGESRVHECYFKSTDGHYRHWDFSQSRLNLNVLKQLLDHGAAIVVDSTRKGKTFPDALSKTVPIWANVLSNALRTLCTGGGMEPSEFEELVLPTWVSPTEADQIRSRVPAWTLRLLRSGHGDALRTLASQYTKPFRCIWVSQENADLLEPHLDAENGVSAYIDSLPFAPIFCISASHAERSVKTGRYTYIQGASDDEESWAKGLTAYVFWENHEDILECEGEAACEEAVELAVHCSSKRENDACMVTIEEQGTTLYLLRSGDKAIDLSSCVADNTAPPPYIIWCGDTTVPTFTGCHRPLVVTLPISQSQTKKQGNKTLLSRMLPDILNDISERRLQSVVVACDLRSDSGPALCSAAAVLLHVHGDGASSTPSKQDITHARQRVVTTLGMNGVMRGLQIARIWTKQLNSTFLKHDQQV